MSSNKKIKLVYWIYPNFGDALGPFLVNKLSNKEIIHRNLYKNFTTLLRSLPRSIKSRNFSTYKHLLFPWERNFLTVGSIISRGTKFSKIWGSGFMNENENFNGGEIYAVRGKFTKEKLIKMGFQCPDIYGDPALLLPLIIPANSKKNDIGIIPHWKETEYFKRTYGNIYKIIDLETTDINKVVSEITSCKMILSTSLHGIIVSHAYGIPALWIRKGYIDTDGFKFKDYFSSVDISLYEGFEDIDRILESKENIELLFKQNQNITLPQKSIKQIQTDLINSAPFEIVKSIKEKLE